MRRIGLVLLAGAISLSFCTSAYASDAKIYYKDGTRLEFDNFDVRFNVQLQPKYSFIDNDDVNLDGTAGPQNTSLFSIRRGRWVVSGNALEGDQFSYKLQYDFASDSGGGDLKDAWIQWNGDPAKVRFGRQKVNFSRQERISSTRLYFVDRAAAERSFSAGRDTGVQAMAKVGDVNLTAGIYNGDTDANDTKHTFAASVDYSCGNYGSRGLEGDFRDGGELGLTAGASVIYGEGERSMTNFDQLRLNADLGLRVAGLDVQGEYFYSEIDFDGVSGSAPDDNGFYVQAMYNMDDLGIGGRFGLASFDSNPGVDDQTEYSLVVNYFLNGHYLKLQNQVTFLEKSPEGAGQDETDFRYDLQLAGYF